MDRFFKQLNAAYSRLVKTGNQVIERETSWSIGDICVAFLPDLDLYIRAKILSFEMPQSVGVRVGVLGHGIYFAFYNNRVFFLLRLS